MKNTAYRSGKMNGIMAWVAKTYAIDPKELADRLLFEFPELKNKGICANCDASMQEYVFHVGYLDAKLLLSMAQIVDKKLRDGLTFTDANTVHVQTDLGEGYTIASRTTIASKLGLIAKVMEKGRHNQKKGWLITKRGWAFLRGESIPEHVSVFRDQIQERTEEMTNIQSVLWGNPDIGYDKNYWFEFGNIHEGKLI